MIKKSLRYLLVTLLCVTFYACSEDDDPKYPLTSIVGQWFVDYSDGSDVHYAVMGFSDNGDFYEREVLVGVTNNINMITRGTYRYNGNIEVIEEDEYDARHFFQSYRVNSVDQYSLDITATTTHDRHQLHRMVGNYDMTPGETHTFDAGDSSFQPFSYTSCDEQIATVDDNGNIYAKKRGVTFIRAIAAKGEAVIEINVKDGDNVIDDFSRYIGCSVDDMFSDYGSNYTGLKMDNGMSAALYNVNDEIVKAVVLYYYVPKHINQISVSLRNRTEINDIIESFDQKYQKLSNTSDETQYYRGVKGYEYFIVMVDKQTMSIVYQWLPNEISKWDGMIVASIDDVMSWTNSDFTALWDGYYRAAINDGVVISCTIVCDEDTREISTLMLTLDSSISEAGVRSWLESFYTVYEGNTTYYITAKKFLRSEYYVTVSTNARGQVSILYSKNAK